MTEKNKTVKKSILEMGHGLILELADHEMKKILSNIADPNTDPKKMRKLTIELKMVPNEDRSQIVVTSSAKTNLAPNKPQSVTLFNQAYVDPVTKETKVRLQEVMAVAPGQLNLGGKIAIPEVIEIVVD